MSTMTRQTAATRIRQKLSETGRTITDLAASTGIPLHDLTAELDGRVPFDYDDFDVISVELGYPDHSLLRAAA